MSSSTAEFELTPPEFAYPDTTGPEAQHNAQSPLKQQVAERLAAHRSRHNRTSGPQPVIAEERTSKGSRIAAAVAERYAQSQSYREFLAAEAQRAIHEAAAAAEVAARSARAIALAQQSLLDELNQWVSPEPVDTDAAAHTPTDDSVNSALPTMIGESTRASEPTASFVSSGLTVRLYEDVGPISTGALAIASRFEPVFADEDADDEHRSLDEEISFRRAPVFEEPAGPTVSLPANLIEFPRQLVASRKARPRIAEGPLREDFDAGPAASQLRIFEVAAHQISMAAVVDSILPEWSSIRLDAHAKAPDVAPETSFVLPPQTAALNLRLMATLVDACLIGAAFLGCATAAAFTMHAFPAGPMALIAAAGFFVLLFLLYQLLFFTLSDATPGMRYARIGLCTFSDENPSRSAMRRRILAIVLAACPLGIGFFWSLLDDDKMGWHDRISRLYQRSY